MKQAAATSRTLTLTALLSLAAVRLAAMALLPLSETTEARYGEMARKMLETGDWVTLWHDYGVPFLAKPPLYAWLSAGSMALLGVNELAARLPSLLLSAGLLLMVGYAARRRHGPDAARIAMLVLAGSFGFFVAAGTVMTDPALVFCTTLILLSFWHALHHRTRGRRWGWLFFAGCGFGLLAKGPVALVIAGLPVFFWVLARGAWKPLWQKLPWIGGSLLTLAIAAPWYVAAEMRTPGFFEYFIVGENISRFLDAGWKGDRYGFAHAYPYGTIWLFVIGGILPWSLFMWRGLRDRLRQKDSDGWTLFLLLWSLTSPVFFTFAANIIWPYALFMQPGFALLVAALAPKANIRRVSAVALATAVAGTLALAVFYVRPTLAASQKDVIEAWRATTPADSGALVFWSNRNEFSAAFYSGGRSRTANDPAALQKLLHNEIRDCIVAYDFNVKKLPPKVWETFREIGRYKNARGTRILLCE